MRYVLQHPSETRPSLLVDVVTKANGDVLTGVREAMLSLDCVNAMVVDPERVYVLRDTFQDQTPSSIAEEAQLNTQQLLGTGGELAAQVRHWLESMSANWSETLPREEWALPLYTDIVAAASDSVIQRVEPDAA